MSRPKTEGAARAVAVAVALAGLLAACSDADLYLDRRETIALGADDAVNANMVEQMVDPWPRGSSNKNIAFNGERMQRAVECYRKDQVTPPVDLDPSDDNSSSSGSSAAPTPVATACAQQGGIPAGPPPGGMTLGSTAAK
jgi:hypothetical protein